jgi:RimJ/RimL family protein N-acetyltransferase
VRHIVTSPGHYGRAGQWAQTKIGCEWAFKDFTAISIIDDCLQSFGQMIATVLYTNYNRQNIEMHVASDGSRKWMTRAFLHAVFAYPFLQLECRRVTGIVMGSNADALRFDKSIGFTLEGTMREASTDGSDLLILGMLREECRFLEMKRSHHGQAERTRCA